MDDEDGFTLPELLLLAVAPVVIAEGIGYFVRRAELREKKRRRKAMKRWQRNIDRRIKNLEHEHILEEEDEPG